MLMTVFRRQGFVTWMWNDCGPLELAKTDIRWEAFSMRRGWP